MSDGAQPAPHRHGGVAVTLAVAAVLAAGLGARAAILLGTAGDELQSSVRTEVKRGAAVVEDVRFVYQDEAPVAYRFAKAQFLAEELRKGAGPLAASANADVLVEADAQTQVARALRQASPIVRNARYRATGGAFAVGRRLADVRRRQPELLELRPEEKAHEGARSAWHGNLDAATTLGPAIAFLFGTIAQAFVRRRRPLLAAAWAFMLAGLVAGLLWEFALP